MILKYRLEVKNNTVEFQVLEQRFSREPSKWVSRYTQSRVLVSHSPVIYKHHDVLTIYLRGDSVEYDLNVAKLQLESPSEAHRVAALIHDTLEEWRKCQAVPVEVAEEVNVFCV